MSPRCASCFGSTSPSPSMSSRSKSSRTSLTVRVRPFRNATFIGGVTRAALRDCARWHQIAQIFTTGTLRSCGRLRRLRRVSASTTGRPRARRGSIMVLRRFVASYHAFGISDHHMQINETPCAAANPAGASLWPSLPPERRVAGSLGD